MSRERSENHAIPERTGIDWNRSLHAENFWTISENHLRQTYPYFWAYPSEGYYPCDQDTLGSTHYAWRWVGCASADYTWSRERTCHS